MKTRVGSTAEAHRLILVLQVILDVAHLMVHSEELFHGYCGALFNPEQDETQTVMNRLTCKWYLVRICLALV